jgi:uncharacterized membrane protein/heat shock protein HslJ
MKTILALVPLALGLSACETYNTGPYGQGPYDYPPPAPYPYPGQPYPGPDPYPTPSYEQPYRAIGTEPGWSLDITDRELRFSGDYGQFNVVQPRPQKTIGVAGEIYDTPRLNVNIVHAECSDGMSDRRYPDRVEVRADGRLYRGCGAPIEFYNRGQGGWQSADSSPPPILPGGSIGSLAETNWRVLSIDNVRVPNTGYYMNFMPDRLSAKFGCNGMTGGYSVKTTTLTIAPLASTRMACVDMGFETRAGRILALPLKVDLSNPERMVLTNSRGTLELQRVHDERGILDRIR